LVDELLDVARVSRGKLTLSMEDLDLEAVLETALEISRPLIEKAGLALTVQAPDGAVRVTGDRLRLAQVVSSLLNNSAKYTQAGGQVSLSARREGDRAVIRVKDTGEGVPPEMLPQVFQMFSQVDRALNRTHGGLGVSLSIATRLVEMHGGSVEARSE